MEDYWRLKKACEACVTAYLWSQGSDAPVQFRTTVTTLSIRVENVSLGNTIPSALCISFKANEKRDSRDSRPQERKTEGMLGGWYNAGSL